MTKFGQDVSNDLQPEWLGPLHFESLKLENDNPRTKERLKTCSICFDLFRVSPRCVAWRYTTLHAHVFCTLSLAYCGGLKCCCLRCLTLDK